jgi:two-component system OmpR family response regulator
MKEQNEITIFLVDDDPLFLKSLEIDFLQRTHYQIKAFATGEQCIVNLFLKPDIIILDYNLDGVDPSAMNGLQTLDRIREFKPDVPVVMLSSQDKIEVAVACMHHKAFDYVVKSETAFFHLQKIFDNIQKYQKIKNELNWYVERM